MTSPQPYSFDRFHRVFNLLTKRLNFVRRRNSNPKPELHPVEAKLIGIFANNNATDIETEECAIVELSEIQKWIERTAPDKKATNAFIYKTKTAAGRPMYCVFFTSGTTPLLNPGSPKKRFVGNSGDSALEILFDNNNNLVNITL